MWTWFSLKKKQLIVFRHCPVIDFFVCLFVWDPEGGSIVWIVYRIASVRYSPTSNQSMWRWVHVELARYSRGTYLITLLISRAPPPCSPSLQACKRVNLVSWWTWWHADLSHSRSDCSWWQDQQRGEDPNLLEKWNQAADLLSRNFQLPFKPNRSTRRQLRKSIQELRQTQP